MVLDMFACLSKTWPTHVSLSNTSWDDYLTYDGKKTDHVLNICSTLAMDKRTMSPFVTSYLIPGHFGLSLRATCVPLVRELASASEVHPRPAAFCS